MIIIMDIPSTADESYHKVTRESQVHFTECMFITSTTRGQCNITVVLCSQTLNEYILRSTVKTQDEDIFMRMMGGASNLVSNLTYV